MKMLRRFVASAILITALLASSPGYGQDSDFQPPGTEETAAMEEANAEINEVYEELMGKLEPAGQKSLKEAQRAWIKWRESEALLIARVGGAIGGSALRVDYLNAQTRLIRQRTEVLREYVAAAGGN